MCDLQEDSPGFASVNLFTASMEDIMELPGIGEKSADKIVKLREIGILNFATLMSKPNFPMNALQQKLMSGTISRITGEWFPVTEPCPVQRSSPKREDIIYQLLLDEREEKTRVTEILKQIDRERTQNRE
jgi:ERCC4-type nuclease